MFVHKRQPYALEGCLIGTRWYTCLDFIENESQFTCESIRVCISRCECGVISLYCKLMVSNEVIYFFVIRVWYKNTVLDTHWKHISHNIPKYIVVRVGQLTSHYKLNLSRYFLLPLKLPKLINSKQRKVVYTGSYEQLQNKKRSEKRWFWYLRLFCEFRMSLKLWEIRYWPLRYCFVAQFIVNIIRMESMFIPKWFYEIYCVWFLAHFLLV